jgi:CRP-like cAMP-binding protein
MHLDPSAFVADSELVQGLQKHATSITCDEDLVLFNQGDPPVGLYILDGGEATLTMAAPAGNTVMSVQVEASSLLGLPGLIGNEPYTLTAIAHKGARFSFINRDDFIALMRTDPLLSLKILQVLAAEVRTARRALIDR